MVSLNAASGFLAAALMAALSTGVFASPTYTQLGDSGSLRVTTYSPSLQVTSATLSGLYGAPTITALPGDAGWVLNFTLNSNFFAAANNAGGGEKETVAGKLDFNLTFDAPLNLTATLQEGGVYSEVGVGDASVFGGMIITGGSEQIGSGLLGSNAVFNPANGTWSSSLQLDGFAGAYQTYRFTIDNDLTAFAPTADTFGSAAIAKKDFQIIITIPEPASLGILGAGALALVSRRRRA